MLRQLCSVRFFLAAGMALALSAGSARAASFGTLSDEVARSVGIIKSSLKGATDIKLSPFTDLSVSDFSGAVTPLILEEFKTALAHEQIVLNDNAAHILTGQFLVTSEAGLKKGELLQLTIKLGLVNRRGQRPVELLPINAEGNPDHFAQVSNPRDLAQAVGFNGKLTSDREHQIALDTAQNKPETEVRKELTEQLVEPAGHVTGSKIHSVAGSPYELEILTRPVSSKGNYSQRMPRIEDGLPWVDLEINEVYAIRIYNNSTKDVAVRLSIDGLNIFHFAAPEFRKEDGTPKFNYYIVHPKGYVSPDGHQYDGTLTVIGWFQKLQAPDNVLSFLVTEYGKGASSRAGIQATGQVGVIHAQFSHCYPLPTEGALARARSLGKETGFGPPQSQEQRHVDYEFERPHEFISVRYDKP